jgi:hypothetical protein
MMSQHIQKDEKSQAIFRKHWLPFVGTLIPILLAAYVPKWLFDYLSDQPSIAPYMQQLTQGTIIELLLFIYTILIFFLFLSAFSVFSDMFLDACIITDRRIIDIEQMGFFNRETSIFLLEHVQDVTIETSGFFQTIFGYGTLIIQTAGDRQFHIPNISRPHKAKRIIGEAIREVRSGRPAGSL